MRGKHLETLMHLEDHITYTEELGVVYDTDLAKAIEYAFYMLEDKQRWIPVTESTPHFSPNKWRKVFVTLEDQNGERFTTTAKYDEDHHYWYDFTTSRYNDFKVVAWMVKPEPFKGDVNV